MSKLHAQWRRLYLPVDPACDDLIGVNNLPALIDPQGQVRAMVLGVAQKAGWDAVARVWQGVQEDWELPAPAIAVDGVNGYQVWFSLLAPVPLAQAQCFLAALRLRYLSTVAPRYISVMPLADAGGAGQAGHTRLVPALQGDTGRWSAFVAPGLASLFAEEPWLDLAPNPDAQANLLAGVESIKPADFQRVQNQLNPLDEPVGAGDLPPATGATHGTGERAATEPVAAYGELDPRGFLRAVMNDPAVALPLRLEAAKALLPYLEADGGQ